MRDFAIFASDYIKKDEFTVSGVKVNNYYFKGNNTAAYRKMSSLVAKDSIKVFIEKVGKYPYKELDIVPGIFGMGFGGMEYPGLVMINATSFSDTVKYDSWALISLREIVAHEIGHQWFYATVGNSEYREAWIDEGFTTYLERVIYGLYNGPSFKYYRKMVKDAPSMDRLREDREETIKLAREFYQGMYLDLYPGNYPSDRMYGDAEYEGAYCFLEEVRKQMGDNTFDSFLKEFYNKYYLKKASTKDVLKLIKKYDGSAEMNSIIGFYFKEKY